MTIDSKMSAKAWESMLNSFGYVPVVVKTLEQFYDASWSMQPNRHEFFEMVYVKNGHAVFEIEYQPVPIGPNDIVIIKPNQIHKLIIKSELNETKSYVMDNSRCV